MQISKWIHWCIHLDIWPIKVRRECPLLLFSPWPFYFSTNNQLAEFLVAMPLREFCRYKDGIRIALALHDEHISWIPRQFKQEAFIMEGIVLTIGIITGLLGVLTVHLIWGKPRWVPDEMGEKGQEPIFSDTFLSRFGQRSLAFVRDDIVGNDHE